MLGELSAMAWLGAIIVLAVGGVAGFFTARQIKDKRTLELEQQLADTKNQLGEYQGDVNRHFLKTSLLFNKLTDDYREVYEHLATGAQKLCNEKARITALDLPEAKILSAAVIASTTAAITAEQQPEAEAATTTSVEAEQIAAEQIEAEHDDAAQLNTESITATENIANANTETAPTENTGQAEPIMAEQTTTEQTATEPSIPESSAPEQSAAAQPSTEQPPAALSETESASNTESLAALAEKITETQAKQDTPTISAEELKILEAEEQKKAKDEDVHLGAESTPGVELEHHKTHPSIH